MPPPSRVEPELVTVIRNGAVVAFVDERHVHLPVGEVAFAGTHIIYVGERYDGAAASIVDASGMIVMPGLVNAHFHATDGAFTRGYWEDMSQPGAAANHQGLYRILPTVRAAVGKADELAAAECAFGELLLSGSTTVVEMGFDTEMMEGGDIATTEAIADLAARSGIRSYHAPRYRSGYWSLDANKRIQYHWLADRGRKRFDDCASFCARYDDAHDGMVKTMLAPGQIDTCDVDMLEESRTQAGRLKVPVQIHAGQSPTEYRTIKSRHGLSTIDFLSKCRLLGPDFIIGHGMYLTEDGIVDRMPRHELAALVESGTAIIHLPGVKARQGAAMRSLGQFIRAGVKMGLGTDTYPYDMIQEMRCAAAMSRVVDGTPTSVSSAEVFHAATVGGADALSRPDLGRLAAGAKADIVLLDATGPHAVPMRDPLGFIVFSATGADVDSVIVNGRMVVRHREITTFDLPAAMARLAEASRRVATRIDL